MAAVTVMGDQELRLRFQLIVQTIESHAAGDRAGTIRRLALLCDCPRHTFATAMGLAGGLVGGTTGQAPGSARFFAVWDGDEDSDLGTAVAAFVAATANQDLGGCLMLWHSIPQAMQYEIVARLLDWCATPAKRRMN